MLSARSMMAGKLWSWQVSQSLLLLYIPSRSKHISQSLIAREMRLQPSVQSRSKVASNHKSVAGAVDTLQRGVDEHWFGEDKGKDTAAQLLVALKIQQNNLD